MDDPLLHVALILHNPQTANEVFLLSLRDCVVTLPKDHILRDWVQRKSLIQETAASKMILNLLEGELKDIWGFDQAITPKQRQTLIHLLDELESLPPYLDYTLFQIVGYLKLGNWVRAEKIMSNWLEVDPIERMNQTPKRRDTLSKISIQYVERLLETIEKHRNERVIVDEFFQGIKDFYSEVEVVKLAESFQGRSERDLLDKFSLSYYRQQNPGFSSWIMNRELEGRQRNKFLDEFFDKPESKNESWVFLGRMPLVAKHREQLALRMVDLVSKNPKLFYTLSSDEEMKGVLARIAPIVLKSFLNEKRKFYLKAFKEDSKDAWSLAQLVEMGQIDEDLIKRILER
ncbi:MAG: hypothetical protein K2P81_10920 [Bacteriovoracaceae bacterium]|nr:hypothetical protein [Bacteriovoracaceae bacterium]